MNIKKLVRNKRKRQKNMLRFLKTKSILDSSTNLDSMDESEKDKFLKRVKSIEFQIQSLKAKFG